MTFLMDLISCKTGRKKILHMFKAFLCDVLRFEDVDDVDIRILKMSDKVLCVHILIVADGRGF